MEAKDTVMHLDDIDDGRMPDSYGSLRKALEKQAGISWSIAFKAGYNQALKDHNLDITTKAKTLAKEATLVVASAKRTEPIIRKK